VNGNPTAQALAAEGYLRLGSESDQVQRVYYYDFDGQNPGWDSGLVNMSGPLLGPHGHGTPRTAWCVIHGFIQGASPAAAASAAMRPGPTCDGELRRDIADAPIVDQAYLSDPLPLAAPQAAETASLNQVGRDVILTVSERVRALVAAL
jgi:hypothetical protein